MSEKKIVSELLARTVMFKSASTPTPMIVTPKLGAADSSTFVDVHLYRSVVDNIAYSVNKVSQYRNNLLDTHWKTVKRVLRYLTRTLNHGLLFQSSTRCTLVCYTDAD